MPCAGRAAGDLVQRRVERACYIVLGGRGYDHHKFVAELMRVGQSNFGIKLQVARYRLVSVAVNNCGNDDKATSVFGAR